MFAPRRFLSAAAAAALLLALPAMAQTWPTKQVTIVVPFPPGGQQDIEGRALAASMQNRLKQPVVVENRPGAGSAIGIGHVAKSAPDGYTILLTGAGPAFLKLVNKTIEFDPAKDLTPVSQLLDSISMIVTPQQTGAKNWTEFMALARKEPGKMNYGSLGVSSVMLAMEGLKSAAGDLPVTEIPYKGAAEYITAGLRNDVQLFLSTVGSFKQHIDAGAFVPLLAVGDKRHSAYPNIPATGELGYSNKIRAFAWTGVMVPAGTPQPIVERIAAEVQAYAKDPGAQARAEKGYYTLVGSTPAEFKKLFEADMAAWAAVAKAINLEPK
jgi:tripartite-type tricarboxylate transporter receptor subunit TctC